MNEEIRSAKAGPPLGPYSQGIRSGEYVFLSGQVGQHPDTGALVPGGVAAQTERALENLAAVLEAGGRDFRHIVRVGVYLTDMASFPEMNSVYARYFKPPFPARTTIAVASLPLGAAVEIDAVVSTHT